MLWTSGLIELTALLFPGFLLVMGLLLWWVRSVLRRSRVTFSAQGLSHRTWTLPWDEVQEISVDRLGWHGSSRTNPFVLITDHRHGWAIQTRSIRQAEALAAFIRDAKAAHMAPDAVEANPVRRPVPEPQPQ